MAACYKKIIKECKESYFNRLNNSLSDNHKAFWRFVRSNKKTDTSIPTLLHVDLLFNEDLNKANIFNNHFKSVFSESTPPVSAPLLSNLVRDEMPRIDLHVNGIRKLFQEIKTSKATGPDNLLAHVLKNCSPRMASYYTSYSRRVYPITCFP